jgi:hypothetical protein
MPSKVMEACAAKLPEPHRSEFLADAERAAALMREAGAILRPMWVRYRAAVGLPPKRIKTGRKQR